VVFLNIEYMGMYMPIAIETIEMGDRGPNGRIILELVFEKQVLNFEIVSSKDHCPG
jgi:hypothetical protein